MPKIRVELEVPKDNCLHCLMFDRECRACDFFNCFIDYDIKTDKFERCEQCKQVEVENDT